MKKNPCMFELHQYRERLCKALHVATGIAEAKMEPETLDAAVLLAAECAVSYRDVLEQHGADGAADQVSVITDALYGMSYGLFHGDAPDPESIRRALRLVERASLPAAA